MASSNGAQSKPPADIHQYSGQSLLAVSTIFVILDTLFTLGRIVSRRMVKKQPIGLDDVLLIPSYLSCLGMCIIGYGKVERHLVREDCLLTTGSCCLHCQCRVPCRGCHVPKPGHHGSMGQNHLRSQPYILHGRGMS